MEPKKPSPPKPRAPAARSGASGTYKAAAAKAAPSASGQFKVTLPRVGKVASGPYKAAVGSRVGAALIDVFIATLPGIAFWWQAGQAGAFLFALLLAGYLLVRDGLPIEALGYASVGKKILGLHVEDENTGGSRIDPARSVKRNWPLVPGILLLPIVASFNLPLGLALAALPPVVEMVMVATDPNGLRLGDRLANTKVLD